MWPVSGQGRGSETRDRSEDLIGRFGPEKGLRIFIVSRDEFGDGGLQLLHTGMRTTFDLALRKQREPALDLIQP